MATSSTAVLDAPPKIILPSGYRPVERPPQILHVPANVASLATARECIDVGRAIGIELDDWQEFGFELFMGERDDGSFASFSNGGVVSRQNGKGMWIELRLICGLIVLGERKLISTAHEAKTNDETFERVKRLIEDNESLTRRFRKPRTTNGQQSITTVNGRQTIRFIARGKASGRGFTGDVVIFDEAMILPAAVIGATVPTMISRPNAQLFYFASAGFSTSVQLHSLRRRALSAEPDKNKRLAYLEYTGEDFWVPRGHRPDIDWNDEERVVRANPAYPHRLTVERMADNREEFAAFPEEFIREHMSVWDPLPSEGGGPIDMEKWAITLDDGSKPVKPLVFSIETNIERSYTSIGLAGLRKDGLPHIELVARDRGTDWVLKAAKSLRDQWKPDGWVIDPSSPAGAFIEPLAKIGIEVMTLTAREVAQACGQICDEIEASALAEEKTDDRPAIPATGLRRTFDADLELAVSHLKTRPLADAWAWDRKDPTVDVSSFMAVTLARFALQKIEAKEFWFA